MAAWDWAVVLVYLVGMLGLSAWLGRSQREARDYYLGGYRTGPLPIALSTMATQCSTNSLLGAPAFVAFTGGLLWLQYELAVPLAMIVLMAVILPVFRRLRLISVYAYLEKRFGVTTRVAMSVLFQFTRAFSTGVTVFGIALVLQFFLGVPFWVAVILLGVFTVIYDVLGGIRAVIWSDVVQLAVLFGAIWLGIALAIDAVGGLSTVFQTVDPSTLRAVDFSAWGWGEGETFGFWPMLFGGLFLYVAYYGVDQTQIQRELSSRSVDDGRRSLFYGGLLRFPLVLSYCFLGVCLAAFLVLEPGFIEQLVRPTAEGETVRDLNLLVPVFAQNHFPVGLLGLLVAGLLAAAMSSLDSTINSLSALTMQDLVGRFGRTPLSARAEFWLAKGLTVFWGAVCLSFAFVVDGVAPTVIESVNKIGSLINGPLLAVFVLGLLTKRANEGGVLLGLATGFLLNLALWQFVPALSWLWWNVTGFVAAAAVGLLASQVFSAPHPEALEGTQTTVGPGALGPIRRRGIILTAYFVVILLVLVGLSVWAGH